MMAASSTQLFSRLKGTKLFKFPSPLPTDSILDCILDANWGVNGIIHVLDILRWHGNDFTDCEANFRSVSIATLSPAYEVHGIVTLPDFGGGTRDSQKFHIYHLPVPAKNQSTIHNTPRWISTLRQLLKPN